MAAQRTGSAVPVDRRSIHPGLPGLPWWGAIAIGVTTTTVGFVLDAGSGAKELTGVFAALYVLGCVAAVLAVRQSGVFTAVIQPPLILFCAVPGAYWLFHGGKFSGIKGVLINCGYPLIERFPLMLFTSAGVLLIGMGRWYFGAAARSATPDAGAQTTGGIGWLASTAEKLAGRLTAALNSRPAHAVDAGNARSTRRQRPGNRPRRSSGSARRFAPESSRHVRPPMEDPAGPRAGRPRRRRPPAAVRTEEPGARRRPRPTHDPGRRDQPTREARRDPRLRTDRPASRTSRIDPRRQAEPPEPRRRRQPPDTGPGVDATHHPISQVRYRNAKPDDEPHTKSRGARRDADSWQYDI